jgi:large subunit ribosomal protein L6
MSRLGKLPIILPSGVSYQPQSNMALIKGPKGEVKVLVNEAIAIKVEDNSLIVAPKDMEGKNAMAMWGLVWSLLRNAVIGVSEGFTKKLEINGVGYKASSAGKKLNLNLGFSHPIEYILPATVDAVVEGNTITLSGVDKQAVGEVAAQIRKLRKPEPYKGKGVKYSDEIVRRKAGKSATKGK